METLHVIDVENQPCLKSKKFCNKSIGNDPMGVLSIIPYSILLIKDKREYIQVKIEEYHHGKLIYLWNGDLTDKNLVIKLEYSSLLEKNHICEINFLIFTMTTSRSKRLLEGFMTMFCCWTIHILSPRN